MMEAKIAASLHLNAPEFFLDPQFVVWLNNGAPKFTWHRSGAPDEYSDVVVLVDPSMSGEGSDSDMPEHIWSQIVDACRLHLRPGAGDHIMVRITNL